MLMSQVHRADRHRAREVAGSRALWRAEAQKSDSIAFTQPLTVRCLKYSWPMGPGFTSSRKDHRTTLLKVAATTADVEDHEDGKRKNLVDQIEPEQHVHTSEDEQTPG